MGRIGHLIPLRRAGARSFHAEKHAKSHNMILRNIVSPPVEKSQRRNILQLQLLACLHLHVLRFVTSISINGSQKQVLRHFTDL